MTHLVFGAGDGEEARRYAEGQRIVFYLGDEPLVDGVRGIRLRSPSDVANAVDGIYGDLISSFEIVNAVFHVEHECGVDNGYRLQIVTEFVGHASNLPRLWGNSTIDGVHGAWNLCRNVRRWLEAPALVDVPRLSCPAISVGAGPSLNDVIDKLPALREKCLIVACDTVAKSLKDAGCDPHVVTPLERLNTTAKKLAEYDGDAVCCGMPVIPKAAADRFKSVLSVCHDDSLYEWACMQDRAIYTGSSSGTLSVAVAQQLTSGPVYLVGHDLLTSNGAYYSSDCTSASFASDHSVQVRGNDGQVHGTKSEWARVAAELQIMSRGRNVVNVAAAYKRGIIIPGTETDFLPDPDSLPASSLSLSAAKRHSGYRTVRKNGVKLADDFENFVDGARIVAHLSDMRVDRWVSKKNALLFGYICRPLICQVSVERRLGRPEEQLVSLWRQRVSNMGDELFDTFKQMAACFEETA